MIVMSWTACWRPNSRTMSAPHRAADLVLAQQRPPGDERCVLLGQPRNTPPVLDDVDDGLLEPLSAASRFVRRPLVLLIDLARDDQDRQLEEACADRAPLASWNAKRALPRAVVRDVGRPGPGFASGRAARRRRPSSSRSSWRDRRQTRQRHRIDVGRHRRLRRSGGRKRHQQQNGQRMLMSRLLRIAIPPARS